MRYRISYLANGVRATHQLSAPTAAAAVSQTTDQCVEPQDAFELLSIHVSDDQPDGEAAHGGKVCSGSGNPT